jgi:hypothetical protein
MEDIGCLQAPCGGFTSALNGCVCPWLTWTTLAPSDDGPPSMALRPADEAGNRPRSSIPTETYE